MDSRSVLLHPSIGMATSCSSSSLLLRRAVTRFSASSTTSSLSFSAKSSWENCHNCHAVFSSQCSVLRKDFGNSVSGLDRGDGFLGNGCQKGKNTNRIQGERRVAASRTTGAGAFDRAAAAEEFSAWLKAQGFPEQAVAVKMFGEEGLGLSALRPLKAGEIALVVPENCCVTAFDVSSHPHIANAASGRGDLIGLTLWLMYERVHQGGRLMAALFQPDF